MSQDSVIGYRVYRSSSASDNFILISDGQSDVSFVDDSVISGATYFYKVRSLATTPEGLVESADSAVVSATAGQIVIFMNNVVEEAGGHMRMALHVRHAHGISGQAMDIRIKYDPTLLTPASQWDPGDVTVERTHLTEDVTFVDNSSVATGVVSIIAVNPEASSIIGNGRLFDVHFRVASNAVNGTVITNGFQSVVLYDEFLNPVVVDYSDTMTFTVRGAYQRGDTDGDGDVDDDDFRRALALCSRKGKGNADERRAGDLNGNGRFDLRDCSLLNRLVNGYTLDPSQAVGGGSGGGASNSSYTVSLGDLEGEAGTSLVVPINIDDAAGVASAQVQLNYDESVLTFQSATTSVLTSGFEMDSYVTNGVVSIVLTKLTPLVT